MFKRVTIAAFLGLMGCVYGAQSHAASSTDMSVCNNFKPPVAVASQYGGKRGAATLLEAVLQPMAKDVLSITADIEALRQFVPTGGSATSGESCNSGVLKGAVGSIHYVVLTHQDGSGWAYQQYKGFSNHRSFGGGVVTLTGTVYSVYSPSPDRGNTTTGKIALDKLRFRTSNGYDVLFTGSLTMVQKRITSQVSATSNFSVQDMRSGITLLAKNFVYTDHYVSQGFSTRTLSGEVYDSRYGYAAFKTTKPMNYNNYSIVSPHGNLTGFTFFRGGPLRLTGKPPQIGYVEPINTNYFAIGLDADGDGVLDESVRALWSSWEIDTPAMTNNSGLAAVPAVTALASLNKKAPLSGMSSYSSDGKYLQQSWRLLYAPPGSTSSFTASDSPLPAFRPDKYGDYLFRLTVSDGTSTASQDIVMHVDNPPILGPDAISFNAVIGPDVSAQVGEKVQLDGSPSADNNLDGSWYTWTLILPAGSAANIVYSKGYQNNFKASFIPDVSGIYVAVFGSATSSFVIPYAYQVINVGPTLHFEKSVLVDNGGKGLTFTTGDFNGDGIDDVAELVQSTVISNTTILRIYYGSATGSFSISTDISMQDVDTHYAIQAADVNNDGRTDILVKKYYGAYVFLQNSDGSLAGPQTVEHAHTDSGCQFVTQIAAFGVGRWKDDSTNSLFMQGTCGSLFELFDAGIDNTFSVTTSMMMPFGASTQYQNIHLADVTGDGVVDFLLADSGNGAVDVLPGANDGSFSTPVVYDVANMGPANRFDFVLGDFNTDGLTDMAVLDGASLDVYQQNASGTFDGPVAYPALYDSDDVSWGRDAVATDIDSDGKTDILVSHTQDLASMNFPDASPAGSVLASWIGIYLQNSGSTLDDQLLYPFKVTQVDWFDSQKYIQLGAADLNHDGKMDILVLDGDGCLKVLLQQ